MTLALKLAHKSISRYRLGAVIAHRGRVVNTGFNKMNRTHPIMKRYNPWGEDSTPGIHAEVDSALGVDAKDLVGAEMYVGRILKNGDPALAKPCQLCQNFIQAVGIRVVYFSVEAGYGRITF